MKTTMRNLQNGTIAVHVTKCFPVVSAYSIPLRSKDIKSISCTSMSSFYTSFHKVFYISYTSKWTLGDRSISKKFYPTSGAAPQGKIALIHCIGPICTHKLDHQISTNIFRLQRQSIFFFFLQHKLILEIFFAAVHLEWQHCTTFINLEWTLTQHHFGQQDTLHCLIIKGFIHAFF